MFLTQKDRVILRMVCGTGVTGTLRGVITTAFRFVSTELFLVLSINEETLRLRSFLSLDYMNGRVDVVYFCVLALFTVIFLTGYFVNEKEVDDM